VRHDSTPGFIFKLPNANLKEMPEKSKTHWKKAFNPNYLGAYSLEPGEELIVTITRISKEAVMNADGREEECLVAYLENQKPFILNKTNAKTIAAVTGSNYIEDWPGKQIQIYAAKVKAFGQAVDALRVRDFPPRKNKLNADRFHKMLQAIEAGQFDKLEALERFELTADQHKQLAAL